MALIENLWHTCFNSFLNHVPTVNGNSQYRVSIQYIKWILKYISLWGKPPVDRISMGPFNTGQKAQLHSLTFGFFVKKFNP